MYMCIIEAGSSAKYKLPDVLGTGAENTEEPGLTATCINYISGLYRSVGKVLKFSQYSIGSLHKQVISV